MQPGGPVRHHHRQGRHYAETLHAAQSASLVLFTVIPGGILQRVRRVGRWSRLNRRYRHLHEYSQLPQNFLVRVLLKPNKVSAMTSKDVKLKREDYSVEE
jgi:hypothetical protein